jgi:endonuclease-3
MKTSRLARETARVLSALSPRKITPPKYRAIKRERDTASDSDSAMSSAPSGSDYEYVGTNGSTAISSRKRKRGVQDPSTTVKTETEETVVTRTSSRKANAASIGLKKAKRQPAKHIVDSNGSAEVEPPPNWEEVYNTTAEMRRKWPAPVDTMGCESLAEDSRPPRDKRFQTLVALMLSSQTKDTVTSVAMKNLQENLPGVSSILYNHLLFANALTCPIRLGLHTRVHSRCRS